MRIRWAQFLSRLKNNLLLGLLVFAMVATPKSVPGASGQTFTVGSASGLPGDLVSIPVRVDEFSDILLFQFSLHCRGNQQRIYQRDAVSSFTMEAWFHNFGTNIGIPALSRSANIDQ